MTRLPFELVCAVIDEAQYNDCLPCCKWLRNYALVARSWSSYAQRVLFRRITLLGGAKQCERLVAALSGSFSRDHNHALFLRRCVRTLIIRTMDHQPIFVDAILLCPNLFQLDVRLCHAWFRPEMLHRLQREGPKIQALHIRSAYYKTMYQLCEAFPSVQYLSLDARSTRSDCTSFTPSWKLRELRLLAIPSVAPDLIEWALSSPHSEDYLEVLHLNVPAPPPLFTESKFSKLKCLHVREINVDDLKKMDSLQEIAFRFIAPTRDILDVLPSTVRHILLPSVADSVEEIIDGLAAYQQRSHHVLRFLTYTRLSPGGSSVKDEDVTLLRAFCRRNNVTFRLMDPPYGTVSGEIEPLGFTLQFPREMPISCRRRALPSVHSNTSREEVGEKRTLIRRIVTFAKHKVARITMSGIADM